MHVARPIGVFARYSEKGYCLTGFRSTSSDQNQIEVIEDDIKIRKMQGTLAIICGTVLSK